LRQVYRAGVHGENSASFMLIGPCCVEMYVIIYNQVGQAYRENEAKITAIFLSSYQTM